MLAQTCKVYFPDIGYEPPEWHDNARHVEACVIKILLELPRRVFIMVEQPAQSWAFKQPYMKDLKMIGGMFLCFDMRFRSDQSYV